jgi:3-deoxy-D-manno-octulosonic-acid transferase
LGEDGIIAVQRSRGFLPDGATGLYVADTVGELGLFYRLAPIVFIGGTLVPKGGQNPIEPAKLGCAILHGPHVDNFVEAFRALDGSGGAKVVRDAPAMAAEVAWLLANLGAAEGMAGAAARAVATLSGALDRTMSALEPYLMQIALERR